MIFHQNSAPRFARHSSAPATTLTTCSGCSASRPTRRWAAASRSRPVAPAATAARSTATDVSARALGLASATFSINGLDVETRQGSWFDPIAGRRFDQVVCNPPFVVGPSRVDYTYRDSGLAGDDASALVIGALP